MKQAGGGGTRSGEIAPMCQQVVIRFFLLPWYVAQSTSLCKRQQRTSKRPALVIDRTPLYG